MTKVICFSTEAPRAHRSSPKMNPSFAKLPNFQKAPSVFTFYSSILPFFYSYLEMISFSLCKVCFTGHLSEISKSRFLSASVRSPKKVTTFSIRSILTFLD